MTYIFAIKPDLRTKLTSFYIQKIDKSALKISNMIIAKFLIKDKKSKIQFFEETFLSVETIIKVI